MVDLSACAHEFLHAATATIALSSRADAEAWARVMSSGEDERGDEGTLQTGAVAGCIFQVVGRRLRARADIMQSGRRYMLERMLQMRSIAAR